MLTFFITIEERRRVQDRAADLDISKSNPRGQYPYVWDNRLNCVKRWYDYGSREDKVATIHLEPIGEPDRQSSHIVECTTEITHHPFEPERQLRQVRIADVSQHEKLIALFFTELLDRRPGPRTSS